MSFACLMRRRIVVWGACAILAINGVRGLRTARANEFLAAFENPPAEAKPWAFWYWMHGCVSREGIDADLHAMQQAGLGGAYLMPIKGPLAESPWPTPVVQLSPEWRDYVRHAVSGAERRGLKLALHVCDGFATAGGPWITPELSMQQLTWSEAIVGDETERSSAGPLALDQPPAKEGHYRDVAVLAFPAGPSAGITSRTVRPSVTTSREDVDATFLAGNADRSEQPRLRLEDRGWVLYEFAEPFTCRSITITPDGANSQAHRFVVEASPDGRSFVPVTQLAPPRHGWHNGDKTVTHAIPATAARRFRFTWNKVGTEPGAEDLDSAKWSPVLKVRTLELSAEPRIHQWEGKNGSSWSVSPWSTDKQCPTDLAIQPKAVLDLTDKLGADGTLDWNPPAGRWRVLRLGHTSTGAHNDTAGGGKGLECDKLNPVAVRLQFERWFAEVLKDVGPAASRTLTTLHVDSWECGSQNWTPGMLEEFRRRRGYEPLPYLPTLAGRPVGDANSSEQFLHDWRVTLNELLQERFFGTLAELADKHRCQFSAECVAPTMSARGMEHFRAVDVPMGEFWLRSPTHDKPNDMLDAISAAHVYGKPIVQAEAFTQLRMEWDEHPALLKPLADRQFAAGANRLVFHVFAHNPWLERRPGMTLDNVGLLFQRGQTWWPAVGGWIDYVRRCQGVLQCGAPVVDVAVFTGEEIPSRAVLPERLPFLPGLSDLGRQRAEQLRRMNRDTPVAEGPPGVRHAANIVDPAAWVDPLNGFAFDSLGPDALLQLCRVEGGRIVLPGGASYRLLVVPGRHPLQPDGARMSPAVAAKLLELIRGGGTVVLCERPLPMARVGASDSDMRRAYEARLEELWPTELPSRNARGEIRRLGDGVVVCGTKGLNLRAELGLVPDAEFDGQPGELAWTHRRTADADAYFIANQGARTTGVRGTFRVAAATAELWDPATGARIAFPGRRVELTDDLRTTTTFRLGPHESRFLVFPQKPSNLPQRQNRSLARTLAGPWQVRFDPSLGGPVEAVEFTELIDWTTHADPGVRHYSGNAAYSKSFRADGEVIGSGRTWIELGRVENLARVTLNGADCGVAWKSPFLVEATGKLRGGENELVVEVYNTWANRLVGDANGVGPARAWMTARRPAADARLLPAGLLGPVTVWREIEEESRNE
ncbi:MAG: hypothetical protein KF688_15335 [Pirellulales bacterium]|nr:hypothetical protein [Pirellulales bacterium]